MAIDVVKAIDKSRGITQTPSVEALEEIVDNRLVDPLFRRIIAGDRFQTKGEFSGTSAFRIRLPDATIVEESTLEKLKTAYKEVGWADVLLEHGNTPETEYQVHLVMMVGEGRYREYKAKHYPENQEISNV
jgi:hypothetical protein